MVVWIRFGNQRRRAFLRRPKTFRDDDDETTEGGKTGKLILLLSCFAILFLVTSKGDPLVGGWPFTLENVGGLVSGLDGWTDGWMMEVPINLLGA